MRQPDADHWPAEYLEGLRHYAAGDYFAAHESWEQRWQRRDLPAGERLFLQALIQSAVIFHLLRLGRMRAAQRMYRLAEEKFTRLNHAVFMGLDVADYRARLKADLAWLTDAPDVTALTTPEHLHAPALRLLTLPPSQQLAAAWDGVRSERN
jgi:predicted nucleic acid-binding protein